MSLKAAAAWTDLPRVSEALERWELLPRGSPKSAVPQLGIDIRKAVARDANPVKSVARYLEACPADFIILASHSHEGRASWLRRPVAATHRPPTIRFFACKEDLSLELPETKLPDAVVNGTEPFLVVGAMAGG